MNFNKYMNVYVRASCKPPCFSIHATAVITVMTLQMTLLRIALTYYVFVKANIVTAGP